MRDVTQCLGRQLTCQPEHPQAQVNFLVLDSCLHINKLVEVRIMQSRYNAIYMADSTKHVYKKR